MRARFSFDAESALERQRGRFQATVLRPIQVTVLLRTNNSEIDSREERGRLLIHSLTY